MIVVVAALCLLPFIYICKYVHPVNDDYFFALTHVDTNCFQAVFDSYLNWSGRYLATLVSSLNPLSLSENFLRWYKIAAAVVVFMFMLTPIVSSVLLFKKRLGVLKSVALGSLFIIVFMSLCPKVSELFYWFSSYVAFTLPSLLALLFFAMLPYKSIPVVVLQFVLAFLIPGGNEVTAILFVMTIAFVAFIMRDKRIIALAVVAFAGILIVIMSPGNGIRMEYQLSEHPYLWAITLSVFQTVSWGYLWVPTLLLATIVYVPLVGVRLCGKIFDIKPAYYILFVLITVFAAHIPSTLGLSSVVIGRTANSLWFFFILYYFFGVQMLINRHKEAVQRLLSLKCSTRISFIALYCFLFLCPLSLESPVATAYFDILSGKASEYDNKLNRRYEDAVLSRDKADYVVEFEPLGLTSKTLFVKELEQNPDECFCTAFRGYWDLKCKVAVKNEDIRFASNFETIFSLGKKVRDDGEKSE